MILLKGINDVEIFGIISYDISNGVRELIPLSDYKMI